jgi:hypothetical protein
LKNKKKKDWIKDFVNNLLFNEHDFEEISPRIQSFFSSEKIEIKKIDNPFENIDDHK